MPGDRRAGSRVKTHESCKVYTSGAPVAPCSVVELSECGARLRFDDEAPVGNNLLLVMEDLGQVRTGIVRWRLGRSVGVEYRRCPDDLQDWTDA